LRYLLIIQLKPDNLIAEILTISGNKVGIGQPNPQYKLDVSGNIRFTGISTGTSNNVLVIEAVWTGKNKNKCFKLWKLWDF